MDLVLYGAPLSPFVRKVDVMLREKGIEFETENVNIPVPDSFREFSPLGRMPALRDRDVSAEGPEGVIPDSSAICGFLERIAPEPACYPKDAYDFGRALWYEEYADSELAGQIGMGVFRPVVFPMFMKQEPDLDTARKAVNESLPPLFDYLEGALQGREYFVGDGFSIADLSVATQLINLELVVGPLNAERWPQLAALVDRVKSRPSLGPNLSICKKIIKEPIDLG